MMRILVVDDLDVDLFLLKSLLSYNTELFMIGVHVHDARNGLEAVEMCKEYSYDLIFMDIYMPVMNGLEAIQEIRQFDSDVVICAISNTEDPEDIQKALNCGADDFLQKPIYSTNLAPKLCHLIALIKSKK